MGLPGPCGTCSSTLSSRSHPDDNISRNDRAWRPYRILAHRYVDGFGVEEIMGELHISLRQFQRDHRKGMLAVANVLWRCWQHAGHDADVHKPAKQGEGLKEEVSRLGLKLEHADLSVLVESVLGPGRALARRYGVWLDIRPPRAPVYAWVDLALAKQALLGVLNAFVATRPSRVEIAWRGTLKESLVDLSIEPPLLDDGTGASREVMRRLGSAGELMHAQGGQLETMGRDQHLAGVRLSLSRARNARILVIDDNDRLLQLFERYLVAEGFRFGGVTSAHAALEAVERDVPGVILLDVMMRDVDGWQLLQRLRANPHLHDVPIIVCSVLDDPELAHALGAQCFLKKPVSQEEVLAAVREALGASSLGARHPGAP